MEFNESLKRLLIEKNMKQADLCRLAHIQTSLMSEYINGKKAPPSAMPSRLLMPWTYPWTSWLAGKNGSATQNLYLTSMYRS